MFYLTPQERKFVAIVLTVFIMGAFVQLILHRDIAPMRWVKHISHFKININTARVDQLQMLPGIGANLAQRIMEYRHENGPYKVLEDIENVDGITKKRFEHIKELIEL